MKVIKKKQKKRIQIYKKKENDYKSIRKRRMKRNKGRKKEEKLVKNIRMKIIKETILNSKRVFLHSFTLHFSFLYKKKNMKKIKNEEKSCLKI